MNPEKAKNIGIGFALKSVSIGLIIAYLIMCIITSGVQTSFFAALFWILRVQSGVLQNFILGIVAFYACGYYFGGRAGIAILVKQHSYLWAGPRWGLFTLLTTTLSVCLIGYGQHVMRDIHSLNSLTKIHSDLFINNFVDYILWPLFYISIFGFIPALLVGLWMGRSINSKR